MDEKQPDRGLKRTARISQIPRSQRGPRELYEELLLTLRDGCQASLCRASRILEDRLGKGHFLTVAGRVAMKATSVFVKTLQLFLEGDLNRAESEMTSLLFLQEDFSKAESELENRIDEIENEDLFDA